MSLAPEFAAQHHDRDLPVFIHDNLGQLFAFVLSFVVIARLWRANQRPARARDTAHTASHVAQYRLGFHRGRPAATHRNLRGNSITTRLVLGLYIGTMALSTLFLAGIALVIYLKPEIESDDDTAKITRLWGTASTAIFQILALAVSLTFPVVSYYSLLLLLLSGPLDAIVKPRLREWDAAKRAATTAS